MDLTAYQQTPSSRRLQQAQDALQGSQEMTMNQYMWDSLLAYLQSPSFFIWWFGTIMVIVGYKVWKNEQRKQNTPL